MNEKEKIIALEEVLDCDEGTLQLETCIDDIEEWDSMAKLSLLAFVKKNSGYLLSAEEISELHTVSDICKYIK